MDPTQADVTECNRRANACLTETGESKSQSGDKKVQYTQCGRMKPLEDLDEDNCEGGLMSKQSFTARTTIDELRVILKNETSIPKVYIQLC